MKRKEGANVQDSGEIEGECVWGCMDSPNRGIVSCKNGRWRNGPFGIDRFVLMARSHFNDKDSPSGL